MLTKDQKKGRLDISKYLLSLYENNPEEFMHRAVTQDETGSITLILKPKSRVCNNGSTLAHPLLRNFSSAGKVMASIFWDSQGIIMVDYLEEGCMINGAYNITSMA